MLEAIPEKELWLSSSRRVGKTLEEFQTVFANRGIRTSLTGLLPFTESRMTRCQEVEAFIASRGLRHFLILDDDASLAGLEEQARGAWVRTFAMVGFDRARLAEGLKIIGDLVK